MFSTSFRPKEKIALTLECKASVFPVENVRFVELWHESSSQIAATEKPSLPLSADSVSRFANKKWRKKQPKSLKMHQRLTRSFFGFVNRTGPHTKLFPLPSPDQNPGSLPHIAPSWSQKLRVSKLRLKFHWLRGIHYPKLSETQQQLKTGLAEGDTGYITDLKSRSSA